MIVLAEQKKASVRVAFIGKKEAENLTYVSADYQAVSRVGGLDENLTVYIGQGKEPLTIRNIQELSAGAAGAVKGMGIKAYEMDIRPFLEAAGVRAVSAVIEGIYTGAYEICLPGTGDFSGRGTELGKKYGECTGKSVSSDGLCKRDHGAYERNICRM